MQDTDEVQKCRDVAKDFLQGKLGVAEAAYLLTGPINQRKELFDSQEIRTITGIASEFDASPLGNVRDLWDANVLIEKDKERLAIEAHYRPYMAKSCEALLKLCDVLR